MERQTGGLIGTLAADNLIASAYPPAEAFVIELVTPGVIERGTVMRFEAATGKYKVLGTAVGENETAGPASCIIAETTLETDLYATAYRTGHFYRNLLIVADEYTMTAADEDNLRKAGILLSDGR